MKIYSNEEIGEYLAKLIKEKFPSQRKFGTLCLKETGIDEPSESDIMNYANKLSQIIKGNKSIQIDDLPVFAELLEVSCDNILSCGQKYVPPIEHRTNYDVAISKDPEVWKEHIDNWNQIIGGTDEYGKTFIDHAIENGNIELIDHLLDEGYITLVDPNYQKSDWGFTYGATSKFNWHYQNFQKTTLPLEVEEQDKLRTDIISKYVGEENFKRLDELKAREIPVMDGISIFDHRLSFDKYTDYINEDLIDAISKGSNEVLDYFSKEFKTKSGNEFIFYGLGKLIDKLINKKHLMTEKLLDKAIAHNKKVCDSLLNNQEKEVSPMHKNFNEETGMVSISFAEKTSGKLIGTVSNVIKVTEKTNDEKLKGKIDELNSYYQVIADYDFRNIDDENIILS